ncbi:MAG: molybdopterin-dependent oxidoreductase [Planctomycetaceae bacterium]
MGILVGQQLRVDGNTVQSGMFSTEEFQRFPEAARIDDLTQVVPGREGRAVRLWALFEQCPPDSDVTHITLHASHDGFAASLPIADVKDVGLIVYELAGAPLTEETGGPFRFLIEKAAPCKTAELDACANVKYLDRIEYTIGKGLDTR